MLTTYTLSVQTGRQASSRPSGDDKWLKLIDPTAEEMAAAAGEAGVAEKYLQHAFDDAVAPRVLMGDNCLVAVVSTPILKTPDLYDTAPIGIILAPRHVITLCRDEAVSPVDAAELEAWNVNGRSHFFLKILHRIAELFLENIVLIRRRTDEIEELLRYSMENKELFQLLDLEKGLTYFTAALRANVIVLESVLRLMTAPKVQQLLTIQNNEEDLLESVIIDNKKALQLAETYSEIMGSLMDAFSSVVAYNLNRVIKFLASITLLIAVPTMVSSFWSMTLVVPWQKSPWGFWLVMAVSLAATAAGWLFLRKKKML
jgi:Mg2+ and Co2+ transporters